MTKMVVYWCNKNPIWHLFLQKKTANTRALNLSISLFNSLSASLLLNIFLSFEVGIARAIANFN